MVTLELAIDTVNQLPEEQQKILFDIFYHRLLEKHRWQIADVFAFHLGTHKLSGELYGLYACICGYDCRIVFQ